MTTRFAALFIAIIAATGVQGQPQEPSGPSLRDVRRVSFPAYDRYPGIANSVPTHEEYARAVADTAFVMERFTYRSDGLDVHAYLYRPAAPPGGRRLPVVIFNRGSYTRDDFSPEVLIPGNHLAHQGFVVVAPMLRGSGGASGHDEMGGADLNDIFNVVAAIKELPYADPTRLFLYGESRGGIMSLIAAREGFPARAIATVGAVSDMEAYLAVADAARRAAPAVWPGFPANASEIYRSRSALRWPEKINAPLLLMHGGADREVTPLHALRLANALQGLGKTYELKIFQGAGHTIVARARERDEDAARWFRRFDSAPQATPSAP